MTREEALGRLDEPPYDQQEVVKDFSYVASKLGISEDELAGYRDAPLKYYWDYPNFASYYRLGERLTRALSGSGRGGAH
jgi:hypothetical protein